MSLIVPAGPQWAYCSQNVTGSPSPLTIGVAITSGATNGDGTAVTGLSALTHDVEFLRILVSGTTLTATIDNTLLLSVLIDPAGGTSWSTLIPSLLVATSSPATSALSACWFEFPLWIPAGASIGLQARSAAAATPPVFRVALQAFGGNRNPASWWCGQRVTAIGTDAANSCGTTHTPGNSGVFSSWTNFGSTLPADCGALQWAISGAFQTGAWGALTYRFEFGVSSVMIGAPIIHATNTNEVAWSMSTGPIFRRLPTGTQLMARATCVATAEAQGIAAYAVS